MGLEIIGETNQACTLILLRLDSGLIGCGGKMPAL